MSFLPENVNNEQHTRGVRNEAGIVGRMLRLTVNLQMAFEGCASSGILSFAFISSRVLQLNVGDFQNCLGLPKSCFFGDVAIYLPPCNCWHWAVTTEEGGLTVLCIESLK